MRRPLLLMSLLSLAILAVVPVAEALAAKKKPISTIKRVSPMRVKVGKTITLRGTRFSSRRKRNTVVFRGANGRSAFAKPVRASRSKIVVKVPGSVERLLTKKGTKRMPTRFKLRVIVYRKYGKLSARRHSPVIVSNAGSANAVPCGRGSDYDGDLLDNTLESKYGLDPCKDDSDLDGISDGWEFWSAKDLNPRALPYPGKKAYLNPLDPSDANVDFDGDVLSAREEYQAWTHTGRKFDTSNPYSPLGYSDGTQNSRPTEQPAVPAFRSAQYGIPFSPPAYPARLDTNGDGQYSDDERDADADGLNNFIETHGPGHAAWWTAVLAKEGVAPWPGTPPTYSYYGAYDQRPFADLTLNDPDADGDTLLDGEDDQDNDGWTNIDEMYNRTVNTGSGPRNTNAFNPCAPETSRTCPRYQPVN